jgi:hypothetical protein
MGSKSAKRVWWIIVVVLSVSLLVTTAGCLRRTKENPSELAYSLPTTITIPKDGQLPGTDIRYQGADDDGAHVLVAGQNALKRRGDSLDWSGKFREGVDADLDLRVLWYTEDKLHLVGTAKIAIQDTNPRPASIVTTSPIKYSGPVAYGLAKGAVIPGSTLTYEGSSDDGAELGGVSGYPYRKEGDSIVWEGELRPGVYSELSLRVVQYDENSMRVVGIVTLWIGS